MHGLLMLLSLSKLGSAVFDRFNFEYYNGTNMSGFEFCMQLVVLPDPRGCRKDEYVRQLTNCFFLPPVWLRIASNAYAPTVFV